MKEKDDLNTELIKAYKLKIVPSFNNPQQNQKENNNPKFYLIITII